MNDTPTPLTDARSITPWTSEEMMATSVPADFARDLERQLAELTDRWERAANAYLIERGKHEETQRQLAEATAWRPIETAPQTGERILAWDHGDVIVVHWEDCSGVSSLTPRMGWATRYDHEYMCYDEDSPTHWQPLPNPPTV